MAIGREKLWNVLLGFTMIEFCSGFLMGRNVPHSLNSVSGYWWDSFMFLGLAWILLRFWIHNTVWISIRIWIKLRGPEYMSVFNMDPDPGKNNVRIRNTGAQWVKQTNQQNIQYYHHHYYCYYSYSIHDCLLYC